MYSTPTRPLIGTAWFPHNLPPHNQRPSNAVVGGTVRNHLVYLTKCDLASTDGRWHQVCGYAYESVTADGLVVMAPNGPIVPDMQYSWLLHERDPRRSEDSSIFVPVPSRGTWVTFDLESVPNPCSAMLGHGQGTSTAWLGRACIPNGNASAYSLPTQSQNEISGSDPDVVGGGGTGADHVRGNDLLPGTIFLHRGQLEFMTSRLEPNGSTTVLSTIANGGRDVFISAKDASRSYNYVHIPRSGKNAISFSLLEMQRNQSWNQFYTRFDWMPLVAEGRDIDGCVYEPVVMCGKPYLPGYLAWCLGPSSVHLGMCFPSVSRELAFYYAPAGSGQVKVGGDEALIPTSKFLVLMSKNDDSETQAEASKSPLLSGNEWNGAVLQLFLVSTAETQEPVPVTRQQNRNLIPSFGALGRGAFTVRSGPTINDQKPLIMPPPTTASLTDTVRTEYLYMALLSSKEKHSQPFNIMMQTPVPSPRNGT
ncbi:hypothetical protein BCR44DRAFT_1429930 [Catenaria anguillulae PL171]|uniref:Uncharacterized protein n=1 Tax=Catenaria anguillulae PL171 TaxID=765915 RepID=A0A1Y2HT50_9FUNG|nr:hypothetical protein BCR44DRAFT_1429930 [Catenaria anguillulae PL171]